mmetsp:Transcript_70113/g.181796  ORF Transcript_70113/g.181796 Transcript_70113/m.181796 type:complete len:373 (+) Transcript_70113:47-1165(+)
MAAALSVASLVLCFGSLSAEEQHPQGLIAACTAGGSSSDHVLLQSHRGSVQSSAPPAPEQFAADACDVCLAAIDAVDGCKAMLDNDFLFHHELADFDAACGHCSSEVLNHCSQFLADGTCSACVAAFDEGGGCEIMRQIMGELRGDPAANVSGLQLQLAALIPLGCQPCGEDAARHCTAEPAEERDPAACEACHEALAAAGACAGSPWDDAAAGRSAAEACADVGEGCLASFEAHCAEQGLIPEKGGCRTAVEGEQCFLHVRWAMQVGVTAHPEWYGGLSQDATFEDFQRHLHRGPGRTQCPQEPCPRKEAACHTAVPGEECYRHVAWAKEVGVTAVPSWYPPGLARSSPAEAFQAWFHRIHHGHCPVPCAE